MMAPPSNPAPRPQPKPPLRHCTVSMALPAAFLIASASATGVADATFEPVARLAATKAAAERVSNRFDIDLLRFLAPGIIVAEESAEHHDHFPDNLRRNF